MNLQKWGKQEIERIMMSRTELVVIKRLERLEREIEKLEMVIDRYQRDHETRHRALLRAFRGRRTAAAVIGAALR